MIKIIRILVISATLFCIATANAEPVGLEKARIVALNFLKSSEPSIDHLTIQSLEDITSTTPFREFYVFTFNNGFILVSGDDCALPILGYSTSNTFVGKGIPEHVKSWLDSYEEQISDMKRNHILAGPEVLEAWLQLSEGNNVPHHNASAVSPLITTNWSQSPLYNLLCPYDNTYHSRAVTGCVATAMAQIMKYWEWPTTGTGSFSYTLSRYGTLSSDFNTSYDWSNMPTELNDSSSAIEINAIALLNYHCGVAVAMDYSTGGSGAYISGGASHHSASHALTTYFKYHGTEKRQSYYSLENWKSLLKTELDNARPVLYGGTGSSGGHAFVCDGYNTSDQFHFNWGWGGSYNGYYTIGSLNPSRYTFNNNVETIMGIEPSYCSYPPDFDNSITPTISWNTHSDSITSSCWKIYKVWVTPGYLYTFKTLYTYGNPTDYDDNYIDYSSVFNLYDSSGNQIFENDYEYYYDWESSYGIKEYTPSDSGYVYLKLSSPYNSRYQYTLAYRKGIYSHIDAHANPLYGGTIEGDGRQETGTTCTLTAYPNEGFIFSHWTHGDTVISTNVSYSFTVVEDDDAFTAHFVYSPGCTLSGGDLPYYIDFEDVNIPVPSSEEEEEYYSGLPPCWTLIDTYNDMSYSGYISAEYLWESAHSGEIALSFYSYDTTGSTPARYCMLPPTDSTVYPISTLQLSFWMSNYYTNTENAYLVVGVMTNPDDTNSFIPIHEVHSSGSNQYEYHTLLLWDYSGPHGRIAIKLPNPSTGIYSLVIDDVVLNVIPTCPAVQNPSTDNITSSSVRLSWNEMGSGSSWTVLYQPVNSPASSIRTLHTNTPFINLTGLTPNTEYTVLIIVDCIDNEGNTTQTSFRTACTNIHQLPYVNDFEDSPNNTTGNPFPFCFSRFGSLYYPYLSSTSNEYNHTTDGSSSLHWYIYAYSSEPNQGIALPEVDPSIDITALQLSFWARPYYSSNAVFQIGVMTDPNDTASFVGLDTVTITDRNWSLIEVPLSSYSGSGRYIAIKADHSSNSWEATIDDLMLNYIPTCIVPRNVYAVNSTSSSILLEWNDTTPTIEWQIEYGPMGYSRGSNLGTLLTTYTHPVSISGLNPSTKYDFYIRPICNVGDTAQWLYPITLHTSPCDNPVTFSIGSNNSTGSCRYSPVGSSNYYSLSEIIIDSSELGGPMDIQYIAFYYDDTAPITEKTNCTIYLQPTTKRVFSSTTDAVTLNPISAIKVYTGAINCTHGWNFFPLDTIYHYDGQQNLLVIIDDNTRSWGYSSYVFKAEPCNGKKLLCYYSSSYNPDITLPSSFTGSKSTSTYRPVMQFIGCNPNIENCTIKNDDLPYTDNFDSYTTSTTAKTGVEPPCWTLAHQYVSMADEYKPMIYYNTSYSHSGSYALFLNYRGIYAMPFFEGDVNTLQLSFSLRQSQAKFRLQVGVMDNLNDASSFTPVATFNNSSTGHEQVSVDFSSYTGSGHYIAFRNTLASGYSGNYSYNFIDDITLSVAGAKDGMPDDSYGMESTSHTLTLYPNPTTGILTVEADEEVIRVDVFDYTGRCVASFERQTTVDLSRLATGLYTLRVTLPERIEVRRVVKQ